MKVTSKHGQDTSTAKPLMKHLAAYASWLESEELDWRHFPIRKSDRAIVKFRGYLIEQRDQGIIAPSTTSARMAAVIRFYRHAWINGFIQRKSPLWKDRQVVIHYHDSVGFERTMTKTSSDLAIPNTQRPGLRLEDGLSPLRIEDAGKLISFARDSNLQEISLMLMLGFLTGARIETITTLTVTSIEDAYPDIQTPNTYRLRVGPGTGIDTKFDIVGEILVPKFLIDDLKNYAYSMRRLKRQAITSEENRKRLFLTVQGNPYVSGSFNRLMTDLRRRALNAGLRFMAKFKFHQTRATFGTWLMTVSLRVTNVKSAVAFVRDAMLHKDEKTTFLYIRFIEREPVKAETTNDFSAAFSGLVNRDWNAYHA